MRRCYGFFFDALLNVNTSTTPEQDRTLRVPALILLDEFAQLGRMYRLRMRSNT